MEWAGGSMKELYNAFGFLVACVIIFGSGMLSRSLAGRPTEYLRHCCAHSRCITCGVAVLLPAHRFHAPILNERYGLVKAVKITTAKM